MIFLQFINLTIETKSIQFHNKNRIIKFVISFFFFQTSRISQLSVTYDGDFIVVEREELKCSMNLRSKT